MKPITYGCEDHWLKMLKDEEQEKRSTDAMGLCKARKLLLQKTVEEAGKDEYASDDLVSDITELFLSGQKMARNPESRGSSSKSLTTLGILEIRVAVRIGWYHLLLILTSSTTRRTIQTDSQIMFQRTTTCFCRC